MGAFLEEYLVWMNPWPESSPRWNFVSMANKADSLVTMRLREEEPSLLIQLALLLLSPQPSTDL